MPRKSMIFTEVIYPKTDLEKRSIHSSASIKINDRMIDLNGYQTLIRVGDRLAHSPYVFGQLVNNQMEPIIEKINKNSQQKSSSIFIENNTKQGKYRISNSPDFSSILTGLKDQALYMITHFEDIPAAMYLSQLEQNKKGKLFVKKTRPLDFSAINGGWVHCAGSVTPWGSHLGSEEYEPNAADSELRKSNKFLIMQDYFEGNILEDIKPNPYDYGFVIEVIVEDFTQATVSKKTAMGRFSVELAYVMPDQRTVYLSDDGTDVGFYRFVSDQPKDLSSGFLFAAKWVQIHQKGKAKAQLEWKNLGHANSKEIQLFLDRRGNFDDLFQRDVIGCTQIKTFSGEECLLVKSGMEKIASRLETRRYAALVGATTEWRKTEGIAYNSLKNSLYLSAAVVNKGMENNEGALVDHIRVDKNDCGAVYRLDLDASYVAIFIEEEISGVPIEDDPNNECAVDRIANPDNLTFIPEAQQLIIAEDSKSGHQNDMLWSYDIVSQKLTRILTAPYGAEVTSAYYYPDIGGYGYLMAVLQHPYGEADQEKIRVVDEARSYVGYLGPFPNKK